MLSLIVQDLADVNVFESEDVKCQIGVCPDILQDLPFGQD